ncbi:serine hydrolase domain-containing protein [Ferrovibrio sp. MS7]|uniref:serine hydrolase domain-containing protein n=1 Tax=Ferrovibrio plantarum TaxID=3119164 RepID=UPI0031358DFF
MQRYGLPRQFARHDKTRFLAPTSILAAGLLLSAPVLLSTAVLAAEAPAELAREKPEALGFSSAKLGAISKRIKSDVDAGTIPGAVLLIARHGKVAYFEAIGQQDPQAKIPMAKDSIFRIYSMTKPITSAVAMQLVEEGKVTIGDPVARYIPSFKDAKLGVEKPSADGKMVLELAPARAPSVQDLLRHTAGITYGFFGDTLQKRAYRESVSLSTNIDNAEFADRIAKLPLGYQPGTTWDYGYNTDVLGRVIEVADGKSLGQSMQQRIFNPLGMKDTAFYVTDAAKQKRVAEPFANDRNIGTDADFFDPRQAAKWESGGGGLTGTAMDYARFLQMMLNKGSFGGKRYLSPATVSFMTADHMGDVVKPGPFYLPGTGYGFGLGFAVRKSDGVSPLQGSAGEYNWGGAGGTYMWVDPKQNLFVVFMMQSPKQRVPYRSLLRDMVYGALTK